MPKPPPPPRRGIDELLAEGLRLHQAGRAGEAAPLYRQVLDRQPEQPAANHLLGLVHLQRGEPEGAVRLISRAIRTHDRDPNSFTNLAVALNQLGRSREALIALDRALALNPRLPGALANRGIALKALGRHDEAAAAYRQALSLAPQDPGLHFNLGNLLLDDGDLQGAEVALREALRLRPWHAGAVNALSVVLEETNRLAEAAQLARDAVAALPAEPGFRYRLGRASSLLRQPAEAAAAFREAVRLQPDYGLAWNWLAETVRREREDDEVAAMRSLAANPAASSTERAFAGFALGRALADLGRHDDSIAAFAAANARWRETAGDAGAEIAALRRRIGQAAGFAALPPGRGFDGLAPIFVVGLPRSGKTTVETLLSANPGLVGVGEQRLLPRLVARATAIHGDRVETWPADAWRSLGADYAAGLAALIPAGCRPIDTLPPNFALVGFIRAALPRATIIHTTRQRGGHIVALFEKNVTGAGYAFTTSITDLVDYHALYLELMAAWRHALPGAVHDLDIGESASRHAAATALALPELAADILPESELRLDGGDPATAAANHREHLAAWRRAHPELFELPNPANS